MPTAIAAVAARIGNAWHIPGNLEPVGMMRQPLAEISSDTSVSIFSGNQFRGPGDFRAASAGWRFDPASGFLFVKFAHAGGSTQVRF